ncbi:rhodanese-like domain-containing protein [Rubrobacter tropicus]|uniref:Rhodanese-like domain-containing protein n=1 Tax=Rubrobacter tropicus TaxID=2653851 RepID=A0A6G8QDD9_9ACTN|nr:rhodanese-like domain-containing protein [Rubrobacter tropicus]QIN84452.1 rhodanese-like domain-containing protein [Rubrobacter tropicus]
MPGVERAMKRTEPRRVPRPVEGAPGLVEVDATWGTIQPMTVASGVRTVGEAEVIEHLEQGLPMVDSRGRDSYEESTIPGATNVHFKETAARLGELDREAPTVFFCNGPQCGQSPAAIQALIEAGHSPEKILYYRGGLHDWMTLGLPVASDDTSPGGEPS